jgi:hypothetical protein
MWPKTVGRDHNLQSFEYVLHPKVAGLQACLQTLKHNLHTVVHDLTIAYKDFEHGTRTSELSLLQGKPTVSLVHHM